jgi:predicted DCC family thiol-disulfide oxidoreductase YuxK
MAVSGGQAVARDAALPPRIVLFDGVCVFCERSVGWLLKHDTERRLHFAPLQGATAAALRSENPDVPEEVATVVYVETGSGDARVYLHSEAAFRATSQLTGPARWLSWLGWLPRWITDPVYGLFVRNRYRIFGRRETCLVPSPQVRDRFLD